MSPPPNPVPGRIVGAVLAAVGLVAISAGLTVLSNFFSNEGRDTPDAVIVGIVVVFLLAPGILAILGALHLFRRGSS